MEYVLAFVAVDERVEFVGDNEVEVQNCLFDHLTRNVDFWRETHCNVYVGLFLETCNLGETLHCFFVLKARQCSVLKAHSGY